MHKLFFSFIALCLTSIAKGQVDIKTYVKENINSVRTIQPDSTNYDDLEDIGKAIADSKIVMMGEQDHGDAPTFLAKTRLIKYLHEKKGFNVIAFESDFFALTYGWDLLEKKEFLIDSFIKKNVFPIWTLCDATRELFFNVIPNSYQTNKPLILTGFDNQMYLNYSSKNLANVFDSVLRKFNLPLTKTKEYKTKTIALIDSISKRSIMNKDSSFYNLLLNQFNINKTELRQKVDSLNYWSIMVDNLIETTIEMKYQKSNYYRATNARDIQMAKNLKWLSTVKFPDEKIIVWAHNYHISKFSGHFKESFLNAATSMATEFTKDNTLDKSTYIIGFTSQNGSAGRISSKSYKVQKPKNNSFENWVDDSYDNAFIDFKNLIKLIKTIISSSP